ncbi:bifunctional phosphopantothenoylcysteine decarboxylase/phosphopantothenate--cysteine ligase CoaBC [Methylomonas rhizoryzae]|uniref:bifunctional phosphopantothenoylcysteine decarboxylase/phosphopantothenate--cysteine ligase CoaBC n=1 Tax=Methylomonas rhizoryzae TaxID=2608981 RepID=UPI0038CBFC3B
MSSKNILLGVCGGIAAYKSAELIRLLRKRGYAVKVVMSANAGAFITPLTLQALSGQPVHNELFDPAQERAMGHIDLARWADLLLIAPASADTLAKMAHGIADDLLSTIYLAAESRVIAAPAMNQAMWNKAVTQENIDTLRRHGVQLVGPEPGEQACGETGFGRMSEPERIVECVEAACVSDRSLAGVKVVISAGPTREPLDPVRFISNRSSGKMGYALAEAAAAMGGEVVLVSGPVQLPPPKSLRLVPVESALEMYDAVLREAGCAHLYIGAAAVADYRPVAVAPAKIKKQQEVGSIALVQNPDIISAVTALPAKPFVVGFAAETDDLEAYALDKLQQKNLDMIAANWVGRNEGGFDSDHNALQVYWRGGSRLLPLATKRCLAKQLLRLIEEKMHEKNPLENP